MKKSLIALAVLAASGAAMAQSSVTLYGRVDAALANTKTTVAGVETSKTGIENGGAAGLTTSRWGMKGTEDLGGGLKANFNLEARFNVDDGTENSGERVFHGNSYVSLSGGFGEVKLGRTYTAFDDVRALAVSNSLWDSAFTPTGGAYGVGGDYAARGDNQIRYDSPVISGFSGALSYALDEKGNKAVTTPAALADSVLGLKLMYAAGPLAVAYGHQTEETQAGAKNKFDALSASYNFGVAALSAGYSQRDSAAKGDDKEYTLGVNVPMGAFQFSVGYAHAENELAGVTTTGEGWGLGAKYSLSKRTSLYAGYKNVDVDTTKTETQLFAVGVRHDF